MEKKTIVLVCSSGMSAQLLANKMQQAANDKRAERKILVCAAAEVEQLSATTQIDALLLGPQIRFMYSKFSKKLSAQGIPLSMVRMSDYGMMDGEKVLALAEMLIAEQMVGVG